MNYRHELFKAHAKHAEALMEIADAMERFAQDPISIQGFAMIVRRGVFESAGAAIDVAPNRGNDGPPIPAFVTFRMRGQDRQGGYNPYRRKLIEVDHCNSRTDYEFISHDFAPIECGECDRILQLFDGDIDAAIRELHRDNMMQFLLAKGKCG